MKANSPGIHRIAFYSLGLIWILTIVWAVYLYTQTTNWRMEVRRLNEHVAYWDARRDFRNGQVRLLRLEGENWELRFSGERDGPFEIWIPKYFPSLGEADRYSTQQYVEQYNRNMRILALDLNRKQFPNANTNAVSTNL